LKGRTCADHVMWPDAREQSSWAGGPWLRGWAVRYVKITGADTRTHRTASIYSMRLVSRDPQGCPVLCRNGKPSIWMEGFANVGIAVSYEKPATGIAGSAVGSEKPSRTGDGSSAIEWENVTLLRDPYPRPYLRRSSPEPCLTGRVGTLTGFCGDRRFLVGSALIGGGCLM
jgi:hypothetical protein